MEEEEIEGKEPPAELTCPEWMMTMGDCMSLLLTFFVLLLTFSTTSQSRLMDVIGVMKGAFSFIETTNLVNREESAYNDNNFDNESDDVRNPKDSSSLRLSSNSIQKKFKDMSETLSDVGFKYPLQVKKLDQGFSIEVSIEDIFVGDTSVLSSNGKKLVQEVANIAYGIRNEIRVMSYLNPDLMKGSKLGNAWLTSIEQNNKLADVLNDKFNIDKTRFSVGTSVMSEDDIAKDPKAYSRFKIIFMEKINIKSVSIAELLKDNPAE